MLTLTCLRHWDPGARGPRPNWPAAERSAARSAHEARQRAALPDGNRPCRVVVRARQRPAAGTGGLAEVDGADPARRRRRGRGVVQRVRRHPHAGVPAAGPAGGGVVRGRWLQPRGAAAARPGRRRGQQQRRAHGGLGTGPVGLRLPTGPGPGRGADVPAAARAARRRAVPAHHAADPVPGRDVLRPAGVGRGGVGPDRLDRDAGPQLGRRAQPGVRVGPVRFSRRRPGRGGRLGTDRGRSPGLAAGLDAGAAPRGRGAALRPAARPVAAADPDRLPSVVADDARPGGAGPAGGGGRPGGDGLPRLRQPRAARAATA